MSGTPWKTEEINLLKQLVLSSKYSFKQLESFFIKRTAGSLQQKSRDLQLDNKYINYKYKYNKNYFNIPNLMNCWYAGWLAADGAILKRKCSDGIHYDLSWECHAQDKHIQELFIKELNYSSNTLEFLPTITPINKLYEMHSRIRINHIEQMAEDLKNNFSIINNKTYRLGPPNLSSIELKLAYLIGLINGDGCIYFDNRIQNLSIYVVSSSEEIIKFVKNTIESFNFPKGKNKQVNISFRNGCYKYTANGISAIYLFDLLRTINVPILSRKWNNPQTLNGISLVKKQHPDWFLTDLDGIRKKIGLIK